MEPFFHPVKAPEILISPGTRVLDVLTRIQFKKSFKIIISHPHKNLQSNISDFLNVPLKNKSIKWNF